MGGIDYKEAAKKSRTSKNYVFKGNGDTTCIDRTEDDVSTGSKSTTTQEKETGESAYWALQRGSKSLCGISVNFWSRVQGNRES